MKLQIVLNGKAAGNQALRTAIIGQRSAGHQIDVQVTWEKGDAERFASASASTELLIAAGGDGTVNEVLHGLMRVPRALRPLLGIIPQGTANDFARGCGIPTDPSNALALCIGGTATSVDVIKANDRWFLNMASAGFGATVTAATPPELKKVLGGAAYTLMGAIRAARFRPYDGRLVLPHAEFAAAGVVAIVGNGRQTGGGLKVTPRAFLDDGLMDILLVRDVPANQLLVAARELEALSADGRYVSYWQVPWAEFHSTQPVPVNLDGEPTEFASVRYEVVPLALGLILPAMCPLIRSLPPAEHSM
jgi:lipid kinase YegS